MSRLCYEEFKEALVKGIQEKRPDCKLDIRKTYKSNTVWDALSIVPSHDSDGKAAASVGASGLPKREKASPTIKIKLIYEQEYVTLQKSVEECVDLVLQELEGKSQDVNLEDLIRKENLVIRLMNYDANLEFLSMVPYRRFMDLAAVCFFVKETEECVMSTACHRSMIPFTGLKGEEELFEYAKENTPRILPFTFDPVWMAVAGWSTPVKESQSRYLYDKDCFMWTLTNSSDMDGSVALMYDDVLHDVAQVLESDFVIIPCSIHELLVLPVSAVDDGFNEFQQMVLDVNKEELCQEERLSNNLYYYSKDKQKLSQMTFSSVGINSL